MKARRLIPYVLLAASANMIPSCLAQSDEGTKAGPSQREIDMLLLAETQALERYEQELAPEIRCEYVKNVRQTCHDMLIKTREDAERAKDAIARYQTYGARQPVDLFDAYLAARTVLEDIQTLALVDEYNGKINQVILAKSYNSFIKITDAWFTGEMRDTIRAANH